MIDGLLTTQEAITILGVTKGALLKRIKLGFIKPAMQARDEDKRRVTLYDPKDVEILKGLINKKWHSGQKPLKAPPGTMKVSESAKVLKVSEGTIRHYIKIGLLKPLEGNYRPILFLREDVDKLIEERGSPRKTVFVKGRSWIGRKPRIERRTDEEVLPNGGIIHWGDFFMSEAGDVWIPITCASCKEKSLRREFHLKTSIKKGQFTGCCVDCYQAHQRPHKLRTNGIIERDGYIYRHQRTFTEEEWKILGQMNPNTGYYVPEHRAVMALYLGRPLSKQESVHHSDGNKKNNSIGNLSLYSLSSHSQLHKEQLKREVQLRKQVEELQKEVKQLKVLLDLYNITY